LIPTSNHHHLLHHYTITNLFGLEDVGPADFGRVDTLSLCATRSLHDGDRQGDRVGLTSDLDVLDVAAVGSRDSGGLLGSFLNLAVVVYGEVSKRTYLSEERRQEHTSDLLCSGPEVLLLGLLDETVNEEVIWLLEG
jgi:hypothetical protein